MSTNETDNNVVKDPRAGLPSASGFERLALCPASWAAEWACNPEPESEDAAAGTRLHAHMEAGTTPEDAEEAEAVAFAREVESALVLELLGSPAPTNEVRETRLWVRGDDGMPFYSGQADVFYIDGNKALVIDYKFGRGGVTRARGNWQLAALAFAVYREFSEVNEVYACIIQPFASRQRPEVVRYDEHQLTGLYSKLWGVVARAMDKGASCHPSPKACKYCSALKTCPALTWGLSTPEATAWVGDWASLTPAQKGEAYKVAKLAERFSKQVLSKVKADLKDGEKVSGVYLGNGKKSFTVTDASKAYAILHEFLGVDASSFAGCCEVSITKLDKLVHQTRAEQVVGKLTVADSKAWLREALSECAESKTSEGSLTATK